MRFGASCEGGPGGNGRLLTREPSRLKVCAFWHSSMTSFSKSLRLRYLWLRMRSCGRPKNTLSRDSTLCLEALGLEVPLHNKVTAVLWAPLCRLGSPDPLNTEAVRLWPEL